MNAPTKIDARHRYPWEPEEKAFILRAKVARPKLTTKMIARQLGRTPHAIDEMVRRLKMEGAL